MCLYLASGTNGITEWLHENVITTATTATKRLAFPVEWGISFAPEDLTDFAQRTCGHKMVQQRRCDKMCLSGTQLCACRGWRTGVLHLNQREYDYVSNYSDFRVIIFFLWRWFMTEIAPLNFPVGPTQWLSTQHFCKQKLFAPHMKKLLIKGVERSRISVSGRIISISMLQFSAEILDRQLVVKRNKEPKKKKTDDILFRHKHFPKWHQYKNMEARSVEKCSPNGQI